MIKVEHTVFALPFALSGLVLGSRDLPALAVVLWTILAFTGARAAAMTLNRVIDARIDARNPRTSTRAIPQGRIHAGKALVFAVASFALMIFAASHLPPLCIGLSPIAVAWLSFYSYTKRFTWLCHLVLGIALGGAALGGWIAAGGQLNEVAPWLLAAAVSAWVAGFDIIYACQDREFDQTERLFSLPAACGLKTALAVSSALHVGTVAFLVALGACLGLGIPYWCGVVLVAVMLCWEHSLVKPTDLSRVNAAFFNVNGCVSIGAFLAILADRLLT
jgi:4-hydroxybenzoate polyprenyltransferase